MIVEYNDVQLDFAEIQSIKRSGVYDMTHTDLSHIRWEIGLVAQYAPNGFPPAVSVRTLRRTPASSLRALISATTGAVTNPFKRFAALLFGVTATPTPVDLRRHDALSRGGTTGAESATASVRGADVFPAAGYGPILTDVTLRNRLMTPRKKLKITGWDWSLRVPPRADPNGKVTLIESPVPPYITDPVNGPHPIALDILSGQDESFAVYFQIETATLPCDDDSDRLVLSHRWQMSHTHDENGYLTRVTDGELVLNAAMVNTLSLNVDLLRAQFFLPIPEGCYRTVAHVTPSADNLTYTYRILDHDQTIVFDAGDSGATQIDIAEKLSYYQPWKIT